MQPVGPDRLTRVSAFVIARCSAWPARGWRHSTAAGSRTDLVAQAVQRLADLGADAEARVRRTVPAPDPHGEAMPGVGLVDQLTVLVGDIRATGDPEAADAAAGLLEQLVRDVGLARH